MSDVPSLGNPGPIASAIHLEFIRSVVDSGEDAGADSVEAFHRALFLNQHGKDLERFRLERHARESHLADLESRLQLTCDRLEQQEKFVPVAEDGVVDDLPNAPWNAWDRTMFVAAAIGILALLLFGVFNVSFNLLESGIVTFSANPIRAYFWAALLPVGALGIKVGWDFLRSRRRRDAYLWSCLTVGVGAVFVWVAAYASVYPTLSKTTDEQIAGMSVFADSTAPRDGLFGTTASGVKRLDMILVASQAIAEICISAALGMYMTQLYGRHRPVRIPIHPVYAQLDADRRTLEADVDRTRSALAEARGDEGRLDNQLMVFVAYARTLYQREIALRRDRSQQKRLLIEEMADQLRNRLEAIDRLSEPPVNGEASTPIAHAHAHGGGR